MIRFYTLIKEGFPEDDLLDLVKATIQDPDKVFDAEASGEDGKVAWRMRFYDKQHPIGKVRVVTEHKEKKKFDFVDAYCIQPMCKEPCCFDEPDGGQP